MVGEGSDGGEGAEVEEEVVHFVLASGGGLGFNAGLGC